MSGTFTSFTGSSNGLVSAMGSDIKNSELLSAINWSDVVPWQFFGFSITTGGLTPNGAPGAAISTDIRNTAGVPTQQSVVPEPATMMLLGTGLLVAFKARRRQA